MTHEQTISLNKISMPLAAMGAIILVILSGCAAYYGSMSAQAQSVNNVKNELTDKLNTKAEEIADKISTNKTDLATEKARSDQLEKRLDRFENKIDALLQRNGVNPNAIQ